MKKNVINILVICLILLNIKSCVCELDGSYSESDCIDTNCRDYSSQYQAQLDFDWNPECRNDLDADNDGIACEENQWTDYYNSVSTNTNTNNNNSGCPTTANCGCSNKNKSVCQGDPCCKWIVGTGCKCS